MIGGDLLEQYRPIVGEANINSLKRLAKPLVGKKIIHVNATKSGGGVAEILHRLEPMMEELGMQVEWQVIEATGDFYNVTKKVHNALHGVRTKFSQEEYDLFDRVQQENIDRMDLDADFVVIHDPQPVGLVRRRNKRPDSRWIWRCHIDVESAPEDIWTHLRHDIDLYDAAMFHLPQYAKPVAPPAYIVPPAIDALSPKNRDMYDGEIDRILSDLGIPRDLPYVVQVSRFDRLKDPVGVVKAWRIVNERIPCRLVLLGGAADDDPEGAEVLAEVQREVGDNDRVIVLNLSPDSHLQVNAAQRAAAVVIQKSLREGFGLVVTEAMWKGKALVGGDVGGIRHQVRHGSTGTLAGTVEGCGLHVLELLADAERREAMGAQAKESVRGSYLLPSLLRNYLLLMRSVAGLKGE